MVSESLELFLALLPKIPLLLRVALLHLLQVSEASHYQDLRTELTVAVLRSFISPTRPHSITATQQRLSGHDTGVRGRVWVAAYAAPPPPETSVRDVIVRAIQALQHDRAKDAAVREPDIIPVEAEWTGYRAGVRDGDRLPDISESDKYRAMMKECKKPTTIMYLHGGAYWLGDPWTHRGTTKKLAHLTQGRCYSVRYRLAPQHPFPAALVDALVSYLTLLYPPPGAFHQAVQPEHLVLAGDSAGANLCLALTQTLLEIRRKNFKVVWYDSARDVPLPAGIALSSPWMDLTASSPSWEANQAFDYLPTPAAALRGNALRPPCDAWPASPPRHSLYADDAFVTHPLVTLLLAPSWAGCPPTFLCTGWELLADEDKYTAARLRADSVPVVFEEYEAMPHCFALLLSAHAHEGARRCFAGWARFISAVAEQPADAITSSFTRIKARTLREEPIDPDKVSPFSQQEMTDQLWRRVEAGRERKANAGKGKAASEGAAAAKL